MASISTQRSSSASVEKRDSGSTHETSTNLKSTAEFDSSLGLEAASSFTAPRTRRTPQFMSVLTWFERDLYRSAIKRVIDFTLASILLALFSPIIALAWICVRLTSPGPGFFCQERMGMNCESFSIFKLRSMYIDQDKRVDMNMVQQSQLEGKTYKPDDDPRVTPVGKFIRKTSIDELPQLWNVIRGDMSLVGPRPLAPKLFQRCPEFAVNRAKVRPGITGMWQVTARSQNNAVQDMAQYDIKYVESCSLLCDVKILVKTPVVVLAMGGAK